MTSIEALVDRQLNRLALRQRTAERGEETKTIVPAPLRIITISRQTGSGGRTLASRLADLLGFEFVDRQILDYIVLNTGARDKLIDSLDEKTRSGVDLWVEGIVRGRYVDQTEYTRWLIKSVTAMAEHGNAVILGRAGNVILGSRGGLHVRVVAPMELRAENLVNFEGMEIDEARQAIEDSDMQRAHFYKDHLGADIDDPLDYHLVINTGRVSITEALDMIVWMWEREMGTL